jgi:hypothetical protein
LLCSSRQQSLTSSTQGICMAKVEPVRRFAMHCLITRPDVAGDYLL